MFPLAAALIGLGYTIVYYGGSMAKTYKAVHKYSHAPDSKGGIPFGVLIGVNRNPVIGRSQENLGEGQAFPPFVTGTWGENGEQRPKGEPR